MRRVITLFAVVVSALSMANAEPNDSTKVSYIPNFHGTVRARFEYATDNGWVLYTSDAADE
ncbi:MAG: hypothetical protein K2K52_03925, partial [Paramuribaculum sp.]|nr:hypothetical protein [Paramuribaculum sp.]